MKFFGREFEGHAKTLVILAAVLLVASGLCGLQLTVYDKSPVWLQGLLLVPGSIEWLSIWISAGGIVVVSALWVGQALYQRFGKPPKDQVQKLFDYKDDEDRKKPS